MTENTSQDQNSAQNLSQKLSNGLLDVLVCPVTRGPLKFDADAQELISEKAGLAYPVRDGIPILLPDDARVLKES